MDNYYGYYSNVNQHSLIVTFAWMMVGLMITGITSLIFASTGLFYYMMFRFPMMSILLVIVQFGIVIAFSGSMYRSSASTMRALFLAYAFTLGISMTSICYAYSLGTISLAFITTAIYFMCLIFVGVTTKKDLSKIGTICIAALMALLITQLIMMLFGVSGSTRFLCIIGLLIFTGLTVWDVQRANQLLISTEGDVVTQEKVSIFMALQLYLDFINVFLYILRILGNRRN